MSSRSSGSPYFTNRSIGTPTATLVFSVPSSTVGGPSPTGMFSSAVAIAPRSSWTWSLTLRRFTSAGGNAIVATGTLNTAVASTPLKKSLSSHTSVPSSATWHANASQS